MLIRRFASVFGVLLVSGCPLFSQALFQKPVKVLGDSDFIGTAANPEAFQSLGPNWVEGRELSAPQAIALDTSVSPPILYIADTGNHRVLGFKYSSQLTPGSVADVVIGQVDRFSNRVQQVASGGRSSGLNAPSGLAVDSAGNLYVADSGNNRILRFPTPMSSTVQLPNMVIGQKSFNTATANLNGIGAASLSLSGGGRNGLAFDATGNLWVADTVNNRVLRFPVTTLAAGANFPAADLVLGQADFVSNATVPFTTASRKLKTSLSKPNGLAFDSVGTLYVTDQLLRVLEYITPLVSAGPAVRILGVDTSNPNAALPTAIALNSPEGLVALPFGPLVADTANNRLMQYPTPDQWAQETAQFSPSATAVIGQTLFTLNQANQGNGDSSAASFNSPVDFAFTAGELYVLDTSNNRVLVFPVSATAVGAAATRVIGQLDFPYNGVNLVDGKGFSFYPGSLPAGAVLDNSVAPARLYVPDTGNNRVLGFSSFLKYQNGQSADLVIGQPDFNRVVVNYPSGIISTPNASSLYLPTSLALDSAGNLYVTDTGNSRVLRFPAPYASGKTALEAADLVLGQTSFTSTTTDATSVTMSGPCGIALSVDGANAVLPNKGYLAVADTSQNRVLIFLKPFSSGMPASIVLGQAGFFTTAASSAAAGFSGPRGVAIDPQDRVIVSDLFNARVQIFDKVSNLVTFSPPLVSLTGFGAPISVGVGPAGDFWVADNNGRMYHYPSVPNLPLTNNNADYAFNVLGPHSAFVDSGNNLLVADAINRIVYFAPQINLNNAATYSTRALSAGTAVALFPTVSTNVIAGGTVATPAPAGQFPLPTTLADTQVTVNTVPVPLLYVSQGQDNIILPNTLATAGTADLLAIKASTGQILGGAEIALAAASPGLFTKDASGAGAVLAVNNTDSTINGPASPVVRGQYLILYGTGVGPVPNPPADGTAASGQPASDLPTVLIANSAISTAAAPAPAFIPATATYSGLAPGFAGLWQINVLIPLAAQSGNAVVIKVLENSIPNLDQGSTLTTTISVK